MRGMSLNNPLNIMRELPDTYRWKGEVESTDPRLVAFSHVCYGLRAGHKLLKNYKRLHGIDTIRGVVERFAPGHENPTESYIDFLMQRFHWLKADTDKINLFDDKTRNHLIMAIVDFEQGVRKHTITKCDIARYGKNV